MGREVDRDGCLTPCFVTADVSQQPHSPGFLPPNDGSQEQMMRKRWTLLAAALQAFAAQSRAQTITIDNVTIVDVTNGRLQPRKAIVIEGPRIARIENASAATRAGATIDGTGM